MKNLSLTMIIYLVFFIGSLLFGFQTISGGDAFKGVLWTIAALCWASCIRNEFRKNNKNRK